jgi:hypothetical protein
MIFSCMVSHVSELSIRNGLLYGAGEYVETRRIVCLGGAFAVCSTKVLGLGVIHI